jgi:hypothetical protein
VQRRISMVIWRTVFRVVCCDIHDDAVALLQEKLQIEAVRSSNKPETLKIWNALDIIFSLSFFSQTPSATWTPWVKRISELLNPAGFILFTTHS